MLSREVGNSNIATSSTITTTKRKIDDMPSAVPAPNASPFLLKAHDVETLTQSDGFAILREHLAEHYAYEYVESPLCLWVVYFIQSRCLFSWAQR